MKTNFNALNEFKYYLENKETGKMSYFNEHCYGNIYEQIVKYREDMSEMCLKDVSNETHQIYEVISVATGETVFKNGKFF